MHLITSASSTVSPVLIELVGAGSIRIQPDRTLFGFAHLGTVAVVSSGAVITEQLIPAHSATQIDAGGDVAPLVAAAGLDPAFVGLVRCTKSYACNNM